MPVLSIGKSSSTFSVGVGTTASASADLLKTGYPTRFYIPDGPTSFTHTVDKTKPLYDYVTEWAENGDWEYRIWASGKKEMWLVKEITVTSSNFTKLYEGKSSHSGDPSSRPSTGAVYKYSYTIGNFPISFTNIPRPIMFSIEDSSSSPTPTVAGSVVNTTETTAGRLVVIRPNAPDSLTFTVCVYFVGDD